LEGRAFVGQVQKDLKGEKYCDKGLFEIIVISFFAVSWTFKFYIWKAGESYKIFMKKK